MLRVESAAATDCGLRRELNEDSVATGERPPVGTAPPLPLWVICDGMGGHAAGEVASRLAAEALVTAFAESTDADPAVALERAVRAANEAVWQYAHQRHVYGGMGTTVVAATVFEDYLVIAHAGDSRAYLLREGVLRQLTDDHSWVAEQERLGRLQPDEGRDHPLRFTITRALGAERDVLPDISRLQLEPGDRVLLCSDGLTNELGDERIAAILTDHASPDDATARLVEAANAAGGNDNISVVVLAVQSTVDPALANGPVSAAVTGPLVPNRPPTRPLGSVEVVTPSLAAEPQDEVEWEPDPPRPLATRLAEAILLAGLAILLLWFLSLATARPAS